MGGPHKSHLYGEERSLEGQRRGVRVRSWRRPCGRFHAQGKALASRVGGGVGSSHRSRTGVCEGRGSQVRLLEVWWLRRASGSSGRVGGDQLEDCLVVKGREEGSDLRRWE